MDSIPASELNSKEAFPLAHIRDKDDVASNHSTILSDNIINEKQEPVTTEAETKDEIEYPKFFPLLLITIALCLAVFCVSLGTFVGELVNKYLIPKHSNHPRLETPSHLLRSLGHC